MAAAFWGAGFFLGETAFGFRELVLAGAFLVTALDFNFLAAFDLVAAFLGALDFADIFFLTAFLDLAADLGFALRGLDFEGFFLTTFFLVDFAALLDFFAALFFFVFFDTIPAPIESISLLQDGS
jgi:hypothetical protein